MINLWLTWSTETRAFKHGGRKGDRFSRLTKVSLCFLCKSSRSGMWYHSKCCVSVRTCVGIIMVGIDSMQCNTCAWAPRREFDTSQLHALIKLIFVSCMYPVQFILCLCCQFENATARKVVMGPKRNIWMVLTAIVAMWCNVFILNCVRDSSQRTRACWLNRFLSAATMLRQRDQWTPLLEGYLTYADFFQGHKKTR